MTEILSLGKSSYLGDINYIRNIDGLIASALTADPLEASNDTLHYHENPIISFILQGESQERINHQINTRSAGDIRFYRAGDLHQVKIKKHPSRNVNFELDFCYLSGQGFSEEEIGLALERNFNFKLIFLRALKEIYSNDGFSDSSIQMLLWNLISENNVDRLRKPKWVDNLRELLNDCWNEQLSLAELSQALNIHPVTISKYFTRYFGCTFGEYMRHLRINKSLSIIKNSRLSLTEIAFLCGFADQSHFTRNFKELTGFTPKDFKKF